MGLVPIFCLCFALSGTAATDGRSPDSAAGTAAQANFLNTELNELLAPTIADLGLELVGIEFSPNGGGSLLRVYIDEPERGVTIEDCERASREISALLDVNDPVSGRYTLEVSSPGLERPLFTLEHFARFVGEPAKVVVNLPLNGRRRFQGRILAVEDDRVVVEQDGAPVAIAHANIAKAQLVPDYVALGLAPAPREAGKKAGKPAAGKKKS